MQNSEVQLRSACRGQYDRLEDLEERNYTLRPHGETCRRLLFHNRDKREPHTSVYNYQNTHSLMVKNTLLGS